MGRVKERGRGRGERKENGLFFLPFPSPFSFFRSFALAATQGLLFLLSPNLPLSYMNQRWIFSVGATRKPLGAKA